MLAAILVNLADYQEQRDGGARPKPEYSGEVKTNRQRETELLAAVAKLKTTRIVKPAVIQQAQRYAEDRTDTQELSNLLAVLSARQFELRQAMRFIEQPDPPMVLALESIAVILTYLNGDEEAILCLLLSE